MKNEKLKPKKFPRDKGWCKGCEINYCEPYGINCLYRDKRHERRMINDRS